MARGLAAGAEEAAPASAAPERNAASATGSWTSTSQLPISMVVPATHVPALALLRSLPASSYRVVTGGWDMTMPSSQVLLLRFLAAFRLA